jgi:hypothetical protein
MNDMYHVWMIRDRAERLWAEETLERAKAIELRWANLFAQKCVALMAHEATAC